MEKPSDNILINSTLAFISAFIITTFIHEIGHYFSYLLFGANPTLFHNYVQTPDRVLNLHVQIISALAGPLFSLIQGLGFTVFISKRRRNSVNHLFFLWLSLLGFVNFFGYLVMTPFTTTGDTGKVAELLNIDNSIRIGIAIVGFALLLWVLFEVAKNFAIFIPAQQDKASRSKYVYRLMFFPIIIGSLANTLLAIPVAATLSIIYPATSSYVIMSTFGRILKTPNDETTNPEFEKRIMPAMIVLVICAITFNRLLTFGIG